MTNIKAIMSAGLMLAVTGVALADPTLKLLPAGAKAGQAAGLVVKGYLGGATSLTAVEIHIKVDAAKLTVAATPVFTVSDTNWSGLASNLVGNEIIVTGAYNTTAGQTTDGGVICTISGTLVGGSTATLTADSNVADQDGTPWYIAGDQKAAIVNGAVRDLGAPIAGAPSTGPGKVVAVAAGGSLKLLSADTLADVAGFTAPAVGAVSGRPAFGMIGADAVVAVGDDAGKLTVVKVADGSSVFSGTLGAKVSTPAIDADGTVYAAVTGASNASLVKIVGGAQLPVATLEGTTVLGAPAVFGGMISVGTDKGVEVFRAADGAKQAGIADAAGANIAPIIANGKGLSANGSNLLGFNAVTGAPAGAAGAHGAGALSEAWYDAASDTVVFGTQSGKILGVNLTTGAPALAGTALTSGAIAAQPIVLGGATYAIDANGQVASSAGLDAPLGAAGAKALAATGRTAGTDSIIAATASGVVASLAL